MTGTMTRYAKARSRRLWAYSTSPIRHTATTRFATSGAWCASFTDPTDNTVISHTSPNSSDSTRLATMSVTSEASAVR